MVLTPGRYVGAEEEEDDSDEFEEKMHQLTTKLARQMEEGKALDEEIKEKLETIGFEVPR